MSLVSTYVKMMDNKWYQNPVLYGKDWYICYDDEDPPELVCKTNISISDVIIIVETLGFEVDKTMRHKKSIRFYPPDYREYCQSVSMYLRGLKNPNLSLCEVICDKIFDNRPERVQGVFYDL